MEPGFYHAHAGVPSDPVGKAFAGSLVTHGIVVALALASGLWHLKKDDFGSPNNSTGSVGIDMVPSIPIPRRQGPLNPVANDTTSVVPPPPETVVKVEKQLKAQPENAIPIPDKIDKRTKVVKEPKMQTLFRPPEPYKNNQVYSNVPQAAVSPMFAMKGSNGIDLGTESVLGTKYGAWTNLMRDRISQHWNRANLHSLPSQKSGVSFTIARSGTVTNVHISQPSGDSLLDTSAERAVLDANPLPSLPPQLPGNDVTVEVWFQLQ